MGIPAQEELILGHVVRPAVDQREQRVLLAGIETGRPGKQAVDAPAGLTGEPEVLGILPVDIESAPGVEAGQAGVAGLFLQV